MRRTVVQLIQHREDMRARRAAKRKEELAQGITPRPRGRPKGSALPETGGKPRDPAILRSETLEAFEWFMTHCVAPGRLYWLSLCNIARRTPARWWDRRDAQSIETLARELRNNSVEA